MKALNQDWENTPIDLDIELEDEKLNNIRKGFCKNWDVAKCVLTILQAGAKKPIAKLILSIAIRIGDSVYKNKCSL